MGTKRKSDYCKSDETSAAIVPHNDRMSLLGLASIQPSSCKSSGNLALHSLSFDPDSNQRRCLRINALSEHSIKLP